MSLPETPTSLTENPAPQPAFSGVANAAIIGIFAILLIGALYYARSFVLPIVLAMLITLTLAPVVRQLGRLGLGPPLAAVLLVCGITAAVGAGALLLSDPVSRMAVKAPEVARELRARFADIVQPFTRLSEVGHEIDAIADGVEGAGDAQKVVVARPGLLSWAAGTVADFGTTLMATLLLVPFLLASGEALKAKLVEVVPSLSRAKQSLRVLRDIENEVSLYLLTVTAINLGLGVCVGIAMAVLGMPDPVLWGIGAAILNFVPYVGAFVGIVLALAVASVTFTSFGAVIAPAAVYVALQFVEGAFITPMILGRRLALGTVAILIALALTTWMWGVVGAIIGVPLLVVVKVFCDRVPSLANLGVFLSAEIPTSETAEAAVHADDERLRSLPRGG